MSQETETALRETLDAFDRYRRRIQTIGWVVAVLTLGMYARLEYLHRTTDDLERILGASVAALTFLIAWVAYSIVLILMRATRRILRAIELVARDQ